MDEAQNTSTTDDTMGEGKTFTQAEVDRIVAQRLKRAKADAAEMEELREKAKRLDELEQANQTELERAQKAYADASAELESLKREAAHKALVDRVAASKAVPASLLHGTTEEELEASADAVLAFAKARPGMPADKGGAAAAPKGVTEEQLSKVKNQAERVRLRAQMLADSRR